MTENMAARGEGLAGLAKSLLNECKGVLSLAEAELVEAVGHTNLSCLKRRMGELETALEAAAPPSTPDLNDHIILLDDELAMANHDGAGFERRAELIEKAFLRVRRLRPSSVPVGEQKQEEGV